MSDLIESCMEFVRRIARYLIGQSAVRIFFGELRGTDFVGSCKEFVRRIAKYPNMQSAIRSLLGELLSNQICRVL